MYSSSPERSAKDHHSSCRHGRLDFVSPARIRSASGRTGRGKYLISRQSSHKLHRESSGLQQDAFRQ